MAIFRLITKTDSEDCFRALPIDAPSAKEAKEKAKGRLSDEEKLVAIDVKSGQIWVNVVGQALKGVDIQKHLSAPVGAVFAGDSYTRDEAASSTLKTPMPDSEGRGVAADHSNSGGISEPLAVAVGKAFTQAIIVCLLRIFTIPWTIWEGACYRLAEQQSAGKSGNPKTNTEFPIFEWFKFSLDGVILLSWPIGLVMTTLVSMNAYRDEGVIFIMGLAYTYFGVIGWSLFKETLTMLLSIALNVEKINHKTVETQKQ